MPSRHTIKARAKSIGRTRVRALKKTKPKSTVFKKISSEEVRLIQMWHKEDGMAPSKIAELLHRNKSTITRHLFQKHVGKQGRTRALTEAKIDFVVKKMKEFIKHYNGRQRVTTRLLQRRLRLRMSTWTILRALHARGIYFRRNREKPCLTVDDIHERMAFARKYRLKPAAWWLRTVHLHIDCKWFPTYLNGKARLHAAKQRYWGAFRARADGDGLREPYVRHRQALKYNTGSRGVMVLAGVGQGKVILWQYVHARWNAKTAANMYSGPLRQALQKAYPHRRSFTVLEDNDPTGFKTRKACRAKEQARIKTLAIPKRSPQLNVLDFAVWAEVNRRMRAQERNWKVKKTEGRQQYLARLRRTALRLPPKFINSSIRNMKVRCQRLYQVKGGHIEEGKMT